MSNGDFNSGVDPVAVIKHILDGYPFGVGIFRELLQNSDDAKASKQVGNFPLYIKLNMSNSSIRYFC